MSPRKSAGKKRKASLVWEFFTPVTPENGISRAVCHLCQVVFRTPGGSTTGMRGHLERKHPEQMQIMMKVERNLRTGGEPATKPEVQESPESTESNDPAHRFDIGYVRKAFEDESETGTSILQGTPPPPRREAVCSAADAYQVTKSIVRYLAAGMQPLRTVENEHYKKMISNMNPAYLAEIGGLYNAVVNALDDLYKEAKGGIQRKLAEGPHFSIQLDLWVKSNSEIYVLVTLHFVNQDWRLETCFLGIRPLPDICFRSPPNIITEKISQVVTNLLEEYHLQSDKFVHVVFNSYSKSINSDILSLNTWPGLSDAIRQSYHQLNELLVKQTNADLLDKARKIGKQVLPNYHEVKGHPGKLMEAIRTFLSSPQTTGSQPLKIEEVEECIKLQDPLNTIVDIKLEEPVITSSSLLPLLVFIRSAYQSVVNNVVSNWSKEQRQEIANAIISKLEICYKLDLNSCQLGDPKLALCSFLDPRFKKLNFLTLEQRDYIYDKVTELLDDLEKEGIFHPGTSSIISVRSENPAYNSQANHLNPESSKKLAATLAGVVGRRPVHVPDLESVRELTSYWDEPVASTTFDPYQWWRSNQDRFPRLAELAKRYFCVVAGNSSGARMTFTGDGKKFYTRLGNVESDFVDKLEVVRRYTWQDDKEDSIVEMDPESIPLVEIKREAVDESAEMMEQQ